MLDQEGNPIKPVSTKVVICIPTRGECKSGFSLDLARLVNFTARRRPDISIGFMYGTGTLIHDLRAQIARDALGIEPDYLFWLDDDMRFPPDALIRLLHHQTDIVGVNYTTRSIPMRATAKMRDAEGIDFWDVQTGPEETGLREVDACGFGCMLIACKVFKTLEQPWFSMPWIPERKLHVGEDVYFCTVARNAGFKTFIDSGLSREIKHVGSFEFSWDHFDAQATAA